jgi:hypothetical protein
MAIVVRILNTKENNFFLKLINSSLVFHDEPPETMKALGLGVAKRIEESRLRQHWAFIARLNGVKITE